MGRTYACIWSKRFELFDDPKTLTFIKPFATYFVKKKIQNLAQNWISRGYDALDLDLEIFSFCF